MKVLNMKIKFARAFRRPAALALTALVLMGPLEDLPAEKGRAARETVNINVVVKVPRVDKVKRELTLYAEKNGGHLIRLSPSELVLSIPASLGAGPVVKKITSGALVVERTVSRVDVGGRIVDLETSIRVKKKHLDNLYKLFARTNFEQTLELEKETGKVVADIERRQGELRYLRERLNNMVVRVGFQYRPPRRAIAPVRVAWLRGINIQDFLRRFAGY